MKSVLLTTLSLIPILIILLNGIYMHELVHKMIYHDGGCRNVSIIMSPLGGFTRCDDVEHYNREYEYYHLMNEIVGYNLQTVEGLLMLVCILLTYIAIQLHQIKNSN